jgi:hypothetical protein
MKEVIVVAARRMRNCLEFKSEALAATVTVTMKPTR